MTDYDELVKSLRNCSNNRCAPCDCGWFDKYQVDESCKEIIMWKAADAIEALQAEVDTLKRTDSKRCQECLYLGQPVGEQQMPKRGEIVRCGECKHRKDSIQCPLCSEGMETADDWFCADGEREVQDDKA